jgi:serum/glucocorticoid-regulated kinase 2
VNDLIDRLRNGDDEIVSYTTVPTNLTYDFYLTQLERDASFLNGQSIVLKPLYRLSRKRIDMRSFNIIKCIGAGGFSKVFLVRYKEDGKFYAMKLIDKHFIA